MIINYLSVPFGFFVAPYLFKIVVGIFFDHDYLPFPFNRGD